MINIDDPDNDDPVEKMSEMTPHSYHNVSEGLMPLHLTCTRRCSMPAVYSSLISGHPSALITPDSTQGWTPLHHACRFKAPPDAIRHLLHDVPELGKKACTMRCQARGRTPLYYALRYDAPGDVVNMLLETMSRAQGQEALIDVLGEDRDGNNVLSRVWKNNKKILEPYEERYRQLVGTGSEVPDIIRDKNRDNVCQIKEMEVSQELKSMWEVTNNIIRAAFSFHPSFENIKEEKVMDQQQNNEKNKSTHRRKWRILHAVSYIKCHPSLFRVALAIHPEQVWEIDNDDLFPSSINKCEKNSHVVDTFINSTSNNNNNQRTALHIAAASHVTQSPLPLFPDEIIYSLLQLWPGAASFRADNKGQLPLHILASNRRRYDWHNHGFADTYRCYPAAAQVQDRTGRTPLHYAASVLDTGMRSTGGSGSGDSLTTNLEVGEVENNNYDQHDSDNDTSIDNDTNDASSERSSFLTSVRSKRNLSILHYLVKRCPGSAALVDNNGMLPLHHACQRAEGWDGSLAYLVAAYPGATAKRIAVLTESLSVGGSLNMIDRNRLPLHLAAGNVDDVEGTLVKALLLQHPRAAMQVDGMGMFPLHVACKAGRDWKITGAIYESYKPAIKEVIDGVASIPTATTAAAANKDVVRGSTPLHLALARQDSPHTLIRALVDSHKGACEHLDRKGQQPLHLAAAVAGEEIIRIVLAGHPEALITPDDRGRVPLACAALSCCHNIDTVERTEIECNVPVRGSISKIESMYTLLRAAPNVLDLKFLRSC